MDLKNLRQEYSAGKLLEQDCPAHPFDLFRAWFQEAMEKIEGDVNAMLLSTTGLDGRPSGRVVLLKELDHGFVWFTNYKSVKSRQLGENSFAALTFWWEFFSRQVRVEGRVEKIAVAESDAYFNSRPAGSRAGAIASLQSSVIPGRAELDRRYQELLKLPPEELKRPENWGGFRLIPDVMEFWQGRESRLHDRICYRLEGTDWKMSRLSP
jgi:pyridoxamine 5'-phosphate oxidase